MDGRPLRKAERPPRPRAPLPCLARRWGAVRGTWLIHLANLVLRWQPVHVAREDDSGTARYLMRDAIRQAIRGHQGQLKAIRTTAAQRATHGRARATSTPLDEALCHQGAIKVQSTYPWPREGDLDPLVLVVDEEWVPDEGRNQADNQ